MYLIGRVLVLALAGPLPLQRVGCSEHDEMSYQQINEINGKSVTLFSNVSEGFRETHRTDRTEKFQLQQALCAFCS